MYDYLIVTHIPAFYKINLYNELNKKLNIFVIFIASDTDEKRSNDFSNLANANFKYKVLFDGNFQSRNIFINISNINKMLKILKFKRLIVSGWDLIEFWYLVFSNKKIKNYLTLESTIIESSHKNIKGFIKKIFLSRISTVFASGQLHLQLLNVLNYLGNVKVTKGVGIINKPSYEIIEKEYNKNFLYIGRLSSVKNLEMMVAVFNELPEFSLTIIGDGSQKNMLQNMANSNIMFKNSINNDMLKAEFLNHDIFILPSLSEPWGLVIEESLYFGLPVIISKNCGASELISNGVNGYIFNPKDKKGLKNIILNIDQSTYQNLIDGVSKFSLQQKDKEQVNTYL